MIDYYETKSQPNFIKEQLSLLGSGLTKSIRTLVMRNRKSRMKGDFHVRFCGNLGVKFPRVTRLAVIITDDTDNGKY
jgi:hypothetical protein